MTQAKEQAEGTKTMQSEFAERTLGLIKEKLGDHRISCHLCGENDWSLQKDTAFVVTHDVTSGKSINFHGPVTGLPLVVLTCNTCGNTAFLNAVYLGLVDSKGEFIQSDDR